MKHVYVLAMIASAFFLSGPLSEAAAADYGLHGGLPWFGYGYSGSLYGLGRVPVPPYYALHPPVYYSAPSPRPYGHSPFAWRSHESQIPAPQPQVTINPFYKAPENEKDSNTDSQTAKITVNPFFLASERLMAE
jgi:hypothetical protein